MSPGIIRRRWGNWLHSRVPYNRARIQTVNELHRMTTSIVSLSEFKAKAAQMLAELQTARHAIVLTQRGAASAVVQDFQTHQRLQEALSRLESRCQALTVFPERGRIVPELRAVDIFAYRELIEGPWRIVY